MTVRMKMVKTHILGWERALKWNCCLVVCTIFATINTLLPYFTLKIIINPIKCHVSLQRHVYNSFLSFHDAIFARHTWSHPAISEFVRAQWVKVNSMGPVM